MISHEHRCIFIHIPKAAGSSIENRLGKIVTRGTAWRDHRTIREMEPVGLRNLWPGLTPPDPFLLKQLRNRRQGKPAPGRKRYASYYKFTFVRNSWDRVFSWYRNVMTNDAHRARLGVKSDLSLRDFLETYPDDWGLRSQLYWLRDSRGDLPFDFIGRFESLADDFAQVAERLDLREAELPHLTRGEGGHYTDVYDPATIALVAERYRDEIDRFAFVFGE